MMRYWKQHIMLAIPVIIALAIISLAQKACA